MRSMTFQVDDGSTNSLAPAVLITITENDDGTLAFSVTQQGAVVGDLRGLFFDVADESLVSHLTVSAAAGLTSVQRGDDSVVDLGNGDNMQGLVGSDGGYDMGLQIGTAGIGKDDYRSFSFTLGTDDGRALTLEDFANVDFGVRLTSVGTLDGSRTAGAKLLETTSGPIDAIDDQASVKEDTVPDTAAGNVFANDHGVDGSHSVVAVNGSAANVGADIAGVYGTLHLNADGSYAYTLDNAKASVQALAEGEQVGESFTYQARSYGDSTSYSDDSASLTITVSGTNDAPEFAGSSGSGIANGGFEEGSFANWQTLGGVFLTIFGSEGVYGAEIDAGYQPVSSLEQFLGVAPGAIGALHPGTATSGSALSTVVSLDAGETVSFDWRFVAFDYLPFNDFSFFTAAPIGGATELSSVAVVGNYGDSGWRTGQYTAPLSGAYEIGFGVVNALDNSVNSYLMLDHVVAGNGGGHSGSVVEDGTSSASGALNFTDVDLADTHTVSTTAMGSGYLGDLSAVVSADSTGTGAGSVGWDFSVDNAALQYLAQGETLTQSYEITLDDGQGGAAVTSVAVSLRGVNDLPSAQAISQDASEDGPAVLLTASYTDPDASDTHFFSIDTLGTTGLVFNNGNGTFTYDAAGRFDSLAEGQTATDSFAYTVSDNHGGSSTNTATVTITGQNDGPVAVNDHVGATLLDFNNAFDLSNYQGFQFSNLYLDGFGDGDGTAAYEYQYGGYYLDGSMRRVDGANFSLEDLRVAAYPYESIDHPVTIVGYDDGMQVASGTLFLTRGNYQTFSFAGDPSVDEVRFLLPHDFNFTYAFLDNVRVGDNVSADQAADIDVLGNDFDPDAGDLISLSAFDATSAYGASISLNADGTLHYDPLASLQLHALGEGDVLTDSFTYTITDTHGATSTATVSVDVEGVNANNQPPVALPDTNAGDPVVESGFTVPPPSFVSDPFASGNVLANDTDPDAGALLHVSAVDGGAVGMPLQGTYGSVQINSDGSWFYTLNDNDADTNALAAGEPASEQFTYTVADQHGATASSTLTVAIAGSEDFAMALPGGDAGSVTEDTSLTTSGQLAAFDPDHGAVLHWQFTGGAGTSTADYHYTIDSFSVTKNGNANFFNDEFDDGAPPPSAPNFLPGTPQATAASYFTRGTFTETDGRAVMDGDFALTTFPQGLPGPVVTTSAVLNTNTDSTNLVNGLKDVHDFTVQGVFDLATPADNQLYGIGLTDAFMTTGNDDLVQLVVGRDASGGARLTLRDLDPKAFSVTPLESTLLTLSPGDEQIRLSLEHHAAQRGEVFASYQILDHDGLITQTGAFSQFGLIFGTDTPGNTADDERFTRATFFTLAQATDSTIAGTYGALHLNALTGHWDYTLNSAIPGVQALAEGQSVTDSFNLFVGDQYNFGALQTINVAVNGSNDAPVAHPDSATTTESQPVLIDVLANDTDVDTGDVLSVLSASAPAGMGSASVSGNQVRFSPGSDFHYLAPGEQATLTLLYTAQDAHGAQSSSTIDVTVTGEPDPQGVVYEEGSRRASGQLSTAGLDGSQPLTATITGSGPGSAAPMANYHFLVDNLNIVRNGSTVFNDGFSTNQPATPDGTFAGGAVQYALTGSFVEAGGRAIMDGTNAFSTVFGTMAQVATLLTDATSSATGGLKQGDSFSVDGRFDLVMPAEEHQEYGIRLSDSVNGVGNDIVELAVRREGGAVVVVLRDIDQGAASATATILESRALNLQPGDNQIDLRLNHAAGTDAITASFTLSGGAAPHGDSFASQGHIFSNEAWTRAAVVSIAPQLPQNGTYGNLSVDADGGWSYQTKNNLFALQSLAQGEQANDVFNVQLADANGVSQTQTLTLAVMGADDVPVITSGPNAAVLMEDHALIASGRLQASDIDHGATLHWSLGDHFISTPTATSAYEARYHFLLDELQITKNGNTAFFDDNFNDGVLPPSAPVAGFSYSLNGLVGEANDRAIFDGSGAAAIRGIGIDDLRVGNSLVLNSNVNSADTLHGLKSTDSFTVSARFDLPVTDDSFSLPTVPHAGQAYGISLSDSTTNGIPPDGLGDDGVFLLLAGAADGGMQVTWADRNSVTDEVTLLGSEALPTVAGATQIVFHVSHDAAAPGSVQASFDLVGPGVSQTFAFGAAGHIFGSDTPGYSGDDENWTRVQIVTTGPDTGGQSIHGAYGTLSIDNSGQWTYVLDNGSPAVQNLVSGQTVSDVFSAQVIDEYGVSSARPIGMSIQGTDEGQAPINYFGSAADETVTGTPAMDFFAGNGGSDTFVFHSASEGPDTIMDFLPGTGAGTDRIDIRDVLAGSYVPGVSNPADFVQVADFGDHSTLMVDATGPADGAAFTDLAILSNVTGWTLQGLLANQDLLLA